MDKVKLEISIPESVYQQLGAFIIETVEKAFTDKARAISKERIKLTRAEACKRLRISLPTLDRHLKDGIIKYQRLGKRILIPEDEIERFLNRDRD